MVCTLMYVDDSPAERELFTEACRKLGRFEARTVESAQAALDLLSSNALVPDVIMSDLHMPGMSGVQFVEVVRGLRSFEDVPIGMLTNSIDQKDLQSCLAAGANLYIRKPLTWEAQLAMVGSLHRYMEDGSPILDEFVLRGRSADHQKEAFVRWNRTRTALTTSLRRITTSLEAIRRSSDLK